MANNKKKKTLKKSSGKNSEDKLTLKYWLIGFAGVAAFVGIVVLFSFIFSNTSKIKFSYDNGLLTNLSTGETYLEAPATFETKYTVKGVYGMLEDTPIYKLGYYVYDTLRPVDTSLYLTDKDGTLFYSSNAPALPSLSGFDAEKIYVCTDVSDDEYSMALMSLTNEKTPDATDFVKDYLRGERYSMEDDGGIPQTTYKLRIESNNYPYFYYIMYLVECDNGDFYVYTDEDSSSIKVSSEWFDGKIGSTVTTAPTTTGKTPETTTPSTSQ